MFCLFEILKKLSFFDTLPINILVVLLLVGSSKNIVTYATDISHKKSKKPIKILVTVTTFPPLSCGTAVLNQIISLMQNGFNVHIYAKNKGDFSLAHPKVFQYKLEQRVYFKELPSDLKTYDIILSQFGYRGKEFAHIIKKHHLKAKLVTCFRGADASRYFAKDPLIYDFLFQHGNLFLPVCDFFKQILIKHGCNPQKIKVLYSSVDTDVFKPNADKKLDDGYVRIVTVCRFVPKKGLEIALKAFALLVARYPQVRYTLVGFGPLEEKIRDLIQELGIEPYVCLTGKMSQYEVVQILTQSDIFLLPSQTAEDGDQEGIPNAIKEAMACELPVVSTDHAGISELIQHGISGFLAPEYTVEEVYWQLEYLITHPHICITMGKKGRERIKKLFDVNVVNKKLIRLLHDLVGIKGD